MKPGITVALVEWNWAGHHPNYFAHFASALLENGVRVLPLCPKPEEFVAMLAQTPAGNNAGYSSLLEKTIQIQYPNQRNIRPSRLRPIEQSIRNFYRLGKVLRRWEKAHECKIDLVFFACIYDIQFEWLRYASPFFRHPWSGLYLHARSFRMPGTLMPHYGRLPCPEKIFKLPSMHSIAVLDERAVQPLRDLTKGKPVITFPDFTDDTLPPQGGLAWGLANKLRAFAGSRKIVICVGHLQKTKGLREFSLAAKDETLKGFCFFLGGEVIWSEISSAERAEMMAIWEQSPNVFTHLQRISDEKTMNAVVHTSDVIFAAYTNFPNSSGILTKAAFFEKPVIVSDGYLMAERARHYQLGGVVPEGDVSAIVATLKRLTTDDRGLNPDARSKCAAYRALHSYGRLKTAFGELLRGLVP